MNRLLNRKPSVLIVDDETGMDNSIAQSLSQHCTTYQVPNNSEALDVIRNNDTIDIVFCGIALGTKGGHELIRQIRSENKDITMIAITALSNPEGVCQAMQSGANNFMLKPLDSALLKMTIQNAARKKSSLL